MMLDNIKMWKPNDRDNRIRILPPTWPDAKHFGFDVYVHYGIGPDRQSYLCLNKMKGKPDPITEEYAVLRRDARNEEEEKEAKELQARARVLVYLIDRDHEKEGVQAWFMPQGLDKDIVMVSRDKSTGEVLNLDDPEDGFDVMFEKNGTGMKTKYEGVSVARRSSTLGKSEWLDFAEKHPLPDQLQYFDYNHIANVFNGGGKAPAESRDQERETRKSDRDTPASHGRDRDDEDARPSSRTSRDTQKAPELTWSSVHDMTADELEDLVDQEKLDIDIKEAKDDEDLADWICDELKLKKTSRRASAEPPAKAAEEDVSSRLRAMRSRIRDE